MLLFRRDEELVYRQQGLERFVEAQKRDYQLALAEVRAGKNGVTGYGIYFHRCMVWGIVVMQTYTAYVIE